MGWDIERRVGLVEPAESDVEDGLTSGRAVGDLVASGQPGAVGREDVERGAAVEVVAEERPIAVRPVAAEEAGVILGGEVEPAVPELEEAGASVVGVGVLVDGGVVVLARRPSGDERPVFYGRVERPAAGVAAVGAGGVVAGVEGELWVVVSGIVAHEMVVSWLMVVSGLSRRVEHFGLGPITAE